MLRRILTVIFTICALGASGKDVYELRELVVNAKARRALHMLAYVREFSSMSTYTDTAFMFREKMVDFMIPTEGKGKFKGWDYPRVLTSQSYYRFVDASGLDSVSNHCRHHFTWSDWIGVQPRLQMPRRLRSGQNATDTVFGKYSPTEIWQRDGDSLTLSINVLADSKSRKYVPNMASFFRNDFDFDEFRLKYCYDDFVGDEILPVDLTGYSYDIQSTGRGEGIFMFNHLNEKYDVATHGEVYIVAKEYISIKEARYWENLSIDKEEIAMYEPPEAPELQPDIKDMIARVEAISHDELRVRLEPDHNLVGQTFEKQGVVKQVAKRLKNMLGISSILGEKKRQKSWRNFKKKQLRNNRF